MTKLREPYPIRLYEDTINEIKQYKDKEETISSFIRRAIRERVERIKEERSWEMERKARQARLLGSTKG